MALQTPRRPSDEDGIHGEQEKKPLFGPGNDGLGGGDSDSPYISPESAKDLEDSVYGPGAENEVSRQDLKKGEESGAVPSRGSVGPSEAGLYNPTDNKGLSIRDRFASRAKGVVTRKRNVVGAIVGGGVIGGGVFLFSIAQGPLQLIHLSQILQKNMFGQEKNSSLRLKSLYRFHRTRDIGETRVGALGSTIFKKTTEQLKTKGIEFPDRDPRTGRPLKMTIDISKDSSLKGLNKKKAVKALSERYGLPESKFARIGSGSDINGHEFGINMADFRSKEAKPLVDTALKHLDDGKIVTGVKTRTLAKFFKLPSLFHPLERAIADKEQKISNKITRRQAEKKRSEARTEASNSRAASARESLKSKLDGKQGALAGSLVATAALCLIRDTADTVVDVNYASVVLPSVIEATDKVAVGAQIQSGNDFDIRQAGNVVESFTNEDGKTIWQGKALDATVKGGAGSGEDIPAEYQQAFSNKTTAQGIKDTTKAEVSGVDFGGAVCSRPGQAVQVVGGLALLAAGPFTFGGSWAIFATKAGAGVAATGGAIHFLQKFAVNLLKNDALVETPLSGPLGGNLLAYGARSGANISARSSGGIELSDTETALLDKQQLPEDKKEFQSKNFLARMFDVKDYRSLASRTIDSSNINPSENINNLATSFTNIGDMLTKLFPTFTPHSYAATEKPYDWSFPRYGISKDIIEDPKLEDPYDNADKVAAIFENNGFYKDRAKKCFGVEISKGSDGWNAVAEEDVNPNDEEYLSANCKDIGDDNWKRVILFVFDTRLMTSAACFEGDEDACSELGANGTSGQSAGNNTDEEFTGDFSIKKLNPPLPGAASGGDIDPKGITLHWWSQRFGKGIDPLVDIFKGNGLSVQIGITEDGEVYQLTESLTTKTSHAIGANNTTIGIEIEGGPNEFGKDGIAKYPKKFEAVVATVQFLKDKYNIPVKGAVECNNVSGIHPHSAYNKCPGAIEKSDIDDYYFNEVIKRVH